MGYVGLLYGVALEIQWGAQNPNCLNPHPPGIKASRVQHLQCLLSWHLRPTQVTAGGPVFRGSFKYPVKYPLVSQHNFGTSELLMGKSTIWVYRL